MASGQASNQVNTNMSRSSTVRTIAMEEAYCPEELYDEWIIPPPFPRQKMTDLEGQRLEEMDQYGIEMSVLSLTVAGPQAMTDPKRAEEMARRGNEGLARAVSRRPDRFAGLGVVSMHDVDAACMEFERSVKELGLRGLLLNNVQWAGKDGADVLFYDRPEYDAFWQMAQDLSVPVYIHPNLVPKAGGRDQDYEGFEWLKHAAWEFATHVGLHALRIMTSGVFDRFPGAQLIIGHNGEHIVHDLWRIDNRLKLTPFDYKGGPIRSYFQTNVHVTTSGCFSNAGLRHTIDEIGADRIMFAVDYPFESNEVGTSWFESAPISDAERKAIGRANAIKLLNLPLEA
jgi:2,3-dihydroxybenzoate decarboxylase